MLDLACVEERTGDQMGRVGSDFILEYIAGNFSRYSSRRAMSSFAYKGRVNS